MQVQAIADAAKEATTVLLWVLLVVALIACVNVVVLQEMRTQPKVPEIGLLRAIGMDDRTLEGIYAAEAALIWLLGTAAGLVLALVVVGILVWLYVRPDELRQLFSWWWLRGLGLYLGGSAVLCWASVWWATRSARVSPPAESLTRQ
jgi:ABC-type lipoprotein release transport system permease subunit